VVPATFGAGAELVAQTNVCKRVAHHDFVIPAPRTVELIHGGFTPLAMRVFSGRESTGIEPAGGNLVGSWTCRQESPDLGRRECPRRAGGVFGHVIEKGPELDVVDFESPLVNVALWNGAWTSQCAIASEDFAYWLA